MNRPLSTLLADGSLRDNSVHRVREGVFRRGDHGAPVELAQGRKANNPWTVWPLLQRGAALDLADARVVFRVPEPDYDHNTDDPLIRLSGTDPLNFTLTTGNLIGCVRAEGHTLRVVSRFGDEFLRAIIAEADGFAELPDHGGMGDGGHDWLLVYFWLAQLRKAFRLGLPKAYETRVERLPRVRGRLDPVDHALNGERGRYLCAYREHRYDNGATRLIARTLEYLGAHPFVHGERALRHAFQDAAGGRRASLRELLGTPPLRNPYFAAYNPVVRLSKQILRDELADVGERSAVSALLFDVSMLFEYFVRKLLRRAGAVFQPKDDHRWTIPSGLPGGQRRLIPDLVFDVAGATHVFDVKYKSFDFRYGVKREDLFQLHTYLGRLSDDLSIGGCGLIYPVRAARWDEQGLSASQGIITAPLAQGGRRTPFHIAFLRVPEAPAPTDGARGTEEFHAGFQESAREFTRMLLARLGAAPGAARPLAA